MFQTYEEMKKIWPSDTRDELRKTMDETMGFSTDGERSAVFEDDFDSKPKKEKLINSPYRLNKKIQEEVIE